MTDKELIEQFQLITNGVVQMEQRMNVKFEDLEQRMNFKFEDLEQRMNVRFEDVEKHINDSEQRISIKIENDVTGKINSLFDGYKLTHEKQWELERETEKIKKVVTEMNYRLTVLEDKNAG